MQVNYNSEWHSWMEYEHNKILLQGNRDDKSIIIKKKYAHQKKFERKFERSSVNFKIKRQWLVLNEMIFVQLVCLHDVLTSRYEYSGEFESWGSFGRTLTMCIGY